MILSWKTKIHRSLRSLLNNLRKSTILGRSILLPRKQRHKLTMRLHKKHKFHKQLMLRQRLMVTLMRMMMTEFEKRKIEKEGNTLVIKEKDITQDITLIIKKTQLLTRETKVTDITIPAYLMI